MKISTTIILIYFSGSRNNKKTVAVRKVSSMCLLFYVLYVMIEFVPFQITQTRIPTLHSQMWRLGAGIPVAFAARMYYVVNGKVL